MMFKESQVFQTYINGYEEVVFIKERREALYVGGGGDEEDL